MNLFSHSNLGRLALLSASILASGCSTNLSGLDGSSQFTCAAPDGVSCMSISGVSANVDHDNLPSSIKKREKEELTRDLNGGSGTTEAAEPTESAAPAQAEKGNSTSVKPTQSYNAEPVLSPSNMLTLGSGTPVRVPPKEMRIWFAPTEDTDGDLQEQRYIYVVVNDGRWMLDATRLNARNKYTNFQPLLTKSEQPTKQPEKYEPQSSSRAVQPTPQPNQE